jgi:hypothetical protein
MAKLLLGDKWFEKLSPKAMYEAEFERIVVQNGDKLFPEYHVVSFKRTAENISTSAKADLALIEKEYREWWLGEIELSNHSFEGHVLPQVRTIAGAKFDRSHVDALCAECSVLDRVRVSEMLKGSPPRVLVVVNDVMQAWIKPLKEHDARVMFIEVFRSEMNEHAFRMNGESLVPNLDVVSECSLDPFVPRFLRIFSPSRLEIQPNQRVQIYLDDAVSEWIRLDIADAVYLSPLKQNPLSGRGRFVLKRRPDGCLVLHR